MKGLAVFVAIVIAVGGASANMSSGGSGATHGRVAVLAGDNWPVGFHTRPRG